MPDITEITTTVIIDGRKPSAPFNIREKISPMKSLKDTPTLPSISLFQKFLETARDKRAFVVGKRRIIIFQAFKVKFFKDFVRPVFNRFFFFALFGVRNVFLSRKKLKKIAIKKPQILKIYF
ncbi:MAG: hypothetical protein L6V79_04750 [Clostridium sp.]|nr:MAG: hypothetical protein L6V79_04750 [Clostridium sp.]